MQEIEISRWLFELPANPANLAAMFCPALVCPQKAILGIKFLAHLCSPLSSLHEKCYQILERLFLVFHHSRNILCHLYLMMVGILEEFQMKPIIKLCLWHHFIPFFDGNFPRIPIEILYDLVFN